MSRKPRWYDFWCAFVLFPAMLFVALFIVGVDIYFHVFDVEHHCFFRALDRMGQP